jgi:K+-sensing histidine kinase KdpD
VPVTLLVRTDESGCAMKKPQIRAEVRRFISPATTCLSDEEPGQRCVPCKIPADVLPRLGERFSRVEKSRSRAGGGSGLGLVIAAGVARAHRGKLRIESMPGVGTSATLQRPCLAEAPNS